eukprot:362748-Chlamydomonas_euryale.AAC.4
MLLQSSQKGASLRLEDGMHALTKQGIASTRPTHLKTTQPAPLADTCCAGSRHTPPSPPTPPRRVMVPRQGRCWLRPRSCCSPLPASCLEASRPCVAASRATDAPPPNQYAPVHGHRGSRDSGEAMREERGAVQQGPAKRSISFSGCRDPMLKASSTRGTEHSNQAYPGARKRPRAQR